MKKYFIGLMKCRLIFFVCGCALLSSVECAAQNETTGYLQSQFNQYNSQAIQEKLFVHTDKPFYVAGDIMWFKVYYVDGNFNKPLDLSKIAYLEVLNKDQKPVLQAKIAMKDGSGEGSFFIPLSLNSGNYKLRAYTNWMKNFSQDFYFEKNITIVNSLKNLGEKTADSATGYDIGFFPEGGNMVSGLQSKIAFRVADQNGKGVEFKGTLTDEENNTVASFQPSRFGIGYFSFTPVANKKYRAIIRLNNSSVVVSEFPTVYSQGYTMHLENAGNDQLSVTVSTNINIGNNAVYLFAHTRQSVKVAALGAMNDGKAVFTIDKSKLGEGISNITIFNSLRQPVCERLYFKKPSSLKITANTNGDEFRSRKKIYVNIDAQADTKPVVADMSLSVYKIDSLGAEPGADILTYLWLVSDLQGKIESPEYYLNNTGPDVEVATDNLMLTHGWRRFKWEDAFQNKAAAFEFIPEYEGHVVAGKITDKRSGSPIENALTYLSAPGTHFQIGSSLSNKKGQILFDIKNFYGSNEIVVQTDNQKDTNYRIDILSPFSEKFSSVPVPSFNISEDVREDLVTRSVGMQVQNAYQNDNLQRFDMPEMADSTSFYGVPDYKFFLDEYTRFNTMEEVMREYITGVSLRKHQQKFYFRMFNDPYRSFFDDDPLVLLDGVPVFDADKIISMNPLKIKKIEVVDRRYYLGPISASGIVSYTTYKGDMEGLQFDPNTLVLEYEGLQMQREFYSPVYETEKQISSRIPDFRNLLYWSPNVKTDMHGKKQLNFYSSDQQGKYMVMIQGITADGKAGSQSFTFDVIK
ncbi:MAG: hypothetical protein JST75_16945 [Bacteroidetes bacterium]|nr:hypothetical protein [Bacteroidota bacterium]